MSLNLNQQINDESIPSRKYEFRIANIVSYIFHPLFIPTYLVILIFNLKYFFFSVIPLKAKLILYANVLGFTFLLPAALIFTLVKANYLKSMGMEIGNERKVPLLIIVFFYILSYRLFKEASLPQLVCSFFLAASVISIAAFIINLFWKISLHAMAMGGMIGMLLIMQVLYSIDTVLWILIWIFIAGLTGTARLVLETHSPAQVYAGYLTGILIITGYYFLF